MALSISANIAQIVAGQGRKPGPIHDAFQAIQNWAAAGFSDADIVNGAGIQVAKTEFASGSASDAILNNTKALKFKNSGGTIKAALSVNGANDTVLAGDDGGNLILAPGYNSGTGKARIKSYFGNANFVDIWHNDTYGYIIPSVGYLVVSSLLPTGNNTYDIGQNSGNNFRNVYAYAYPGTSFLSHKDVKTWVDDEKRDFIGSLPRLIEFTWKDKTRIDGDVGPEKTPEQLAEDKRQAKRVILGYVGDDLPDTIADPATESVNLPSIIAMAIGAIKQLAAKNTELEKRIADLESR